MAIDHRIGTKILKNLNAASAPATSLSPYPLIGIVKNNLDPTRSGRLQVFIPQMGGNPDDPANWQTVSYASPFHGSTSTEISLADTPDTNNTFNSVSHSYGMWMVPPDLGVEVIVLFIAGDPMLGYWLACVNSKLSHHMIPAMAGSKNVDTTGATANTKASYSQGDQVPVVEFNENTPAASTNPNFYNAPKPIHEIQYAILKQQGLEKDNIRGTISSSSQRETPSQVFGISTPGRPTNDPKDDPLYLNKLAAGTLTENYYRVKSRKGGHTFVMDDGSVLGTDQLIRLRTAGGHQFLMHDTKETIYIGHAKGNSWVELAEDGSINLYSHGGFNLRSEGDINFHSDGNINLNADKQLNLHANRISNVAATYSLPDTIFRSNTGSWNSIDDQLNSITTVAPTHEPFNRLSVASTSDTIELSSSTFVDMNQLIEANVGMKGYVDSVASQSTYGDSNVNAYLTEFDGNIVPSANLIYSLGNITHQWKDLFVGNSTIYVGGVPVSVDSVGNLTVNGTVIPTIGYVDARVSDIGGSSYGNANVGAYLIANNYLTSASANLSLYVWNANVTAANVGMKGYVDNSVSTANIGIIGYIDRGNSIQATAITSANLGMKGYIDSQTFYSNARVATYLQSGNPSNISVAGNVTATYFIGNGALLTGIAASSSYGNTQVEVFTNLSNYAYNANVTSANIGMKGYVDNSVSTANIGMKGYVDSVASQSPYGNVNVKAYTESMGFANYSNVNVAAYVTTNGLTNYSNVNVIAYTQTQSYTNYSNVNLSAYLGGSVTIGGNLTVNGNVFINGNSTIINANNLSINDSMIYLADDNPADTLDIGIVSAFTSAVRYQHTGLVRDATDGVWKLFANVVAEPTTTVDFTNANYSNLRIGNLIANTVGIGTTTPSAFCHTTGAGVGFKHTNGSITLEMYSDNVNGVQTANGPLFVQTTGANPFIINTNSVERMRVNPAGNVGINTSTDTGAKLTIDTGTLGTTLGSQGKYQIFASNDTANGDFFEITNTRAIAGNSWSGAGTRLQQKIDVTYMGYIQFNGGSGTTNDGGISFGTGTSANAVAISERVRINSAGDVGIGNAAPLHKLSVSGDVFASGNILSTGAIFNSLTVNGNISGTYFIGDGSQLTNLPGGGSYSNVQVAAYLPTYSGVLGSSNLQVTGGGSFTGTLTVGAGGFINSGGNIVATGGILNSLAVNGNISAGNANISSTTASSSTTNGALRVAGGVGIGGNLNVGGRLNVGSTVTVTNGSINLSEAWQVQWGNGSTYINGSNADIYSNAGGSRIFTGTSTTFTIDPATASSSTTTGALVVTGGVGIAGNLNVGGNITANVSGFSIGYRDLPQVTASNVTLALADASKHFYANTTAPTTITVPSNANVAFPIGTTIVIVNRGSGNITIQNQGAGGGPFLYLAGNATTTSSRILTQYGMATLVKTETNLWFVNGTGVV